MEYSIDHIISGALEMSVLRGVYTLALSAGGVEELDTYTVCGAEVHPSYATAKFL
jgi:hypothetical protein